MPLSKFKGITVLVIEDSERSFSLAKDVLATFGIKQVYSAYTLQESFDAFKAHSPDIIFVDGVLNFDNGLALTKKIRLGKNSPDPAIPIILMVTAPTKNQFLVARDAGVSEFLVKPYTANGMYKKLENLIENPKPFVKAENFFGPERRIKKEAAFSGDNRRTRAPLIIDAKEGRRLLREQFKSKTPADEE